jgi:hypothetical protein
LEFAGVLGFEPRLTVLETVVLPLTLHPHVSTEISQQINLFLFAFLMWRVLGTLPAKLFELERTLYCLFVLVRPVVRFLALTALQFYDIILTHMFY